MARLHDLPPEVLVNIFVEAGIANGSSQDLYSLATSSKWLYACFKAQEYQIFSRVGKGLIPSGPGIFELIINLRYLRRASPEEATVLLADYSLGEDWEVDGVMFDIHEDIHIEGLTNLYGEMLSWMRHAGLAYLQAGSATDFIHHYDHPPPHFLHLLPQQHRAKAYHLCIRMQSINHEFENSYGMGYLKRAEKEAHFLGQQFEKLLGHIPGCYVPRPVVCASLQRVSGIAHPPFPLRRMVRFVIKIHAPEGLQSCWS
jgi:hypothetical protein